MERERAIAIGQCISILILMSLGTVLTKMSLGNVEPLTFVGVSVLIGMVAMSIYTFVLKGERVPSGLSGSIWFYIIAIGVGNFAIVRVLSTASLDLMPASTNTFLTNFVGFVTMGMSIFILKESPTPFQVLGAIIAIIGIRVFFPTLPSPEELTGILLIGLSILALGYTNNIARKLAVESKGQVSNNIISTMALLIGGAITVVICFALEWPPKITAGTDWMNALYAGLVMIALGLTLWNHILRTLRSYEASILGASTVIWTTLLAIPMLGEKVSGHQIAGMALLVIGLATVQIRSNMSLGTLFGRKASRSTEA